PFQMPQPRQRHVVNSETNNSQYDQGDESFEDGKPGFSSPRFVNVPGAEGRTRPSARSPENHRASLRSSHGLPTATGQYSQPRRRPVLMPSVRAGKSTAGHTTPPYSSEYLPYSSRRSGAASRVPRPTEADSTYVASSCSKGLMYSALRPAHGRTPATSAP